MMTENSSAKNPRAARLRRAAVVGVGLIVLGTLAVVASQTGDEPPIRVRSGSMIFEVTPPARWVADGGNWTPSTGTNQGSLRVVVLSAEGYNCTGTYQGTSVEVTYDQTTTVRLVRGGNGRTVLAPGNVLTLVPGSNDSQLVHGQGGTGRITGLVVRGAGQPSSCSVQPNAPQPRIELLVCSWDPSRPCQ